MARSFDLIFRSKRKALWQPHEKTARWRFMDFNLQTQSCCFKLFSAFRSTKSAGSLCILKSKLLKCPASFSVQRFRPKTLQDLGAFESVCPVWSSESEEEVSSALMFQISARTLKLIELIEPARSKRGFLVWKTRFSPPKRVARNFSAKLVWKF